MGKHQDIGGSCLHIASRKQTKPVKKGLGVVKGMLQLSTNKLTPAS